jgi:hypothetical protein
MYPTQTIRVDLTMVSKDRYLRRLLIQNAWAISHMKDCYLTAVFYRIAARRGMKKAAVAVAHKVLVIAYHEIRDGVEYRDAGGDYFDRRDPVRTAKRLVLLCYKGLILHDLTDDAILIM